MVECSLCHQRGHTRGSQKYHPPPCEYCQNTNCNKYTTNKDIAKCDKRKIDEYTKRQVKKCQEYYDECCEKIDSRLAKYPQSWHNRTAGDPWISAFNKFKASMPSYTTIDTMKASVRCDGGHLTTDWGYQVRLSYEKYYRRDFERTLEEKQAEWKAIKEQREAEEKSKELLPGN